MHYMHWQQREERAFLAGVGDAQRGYAPQYTDGHYLGGYESVKPYWRY